MGCPNCSNFSCQRGSICQNLITNGLNCGGWVNQAFIPVVAEKCGCAPLVGSNCVWYQGSTTPCLGIITGSNFTSIIQAIDKAICLISPSGVPSGSPSGVPTVSGTVNQIIVTPTGISPIINYQVGLSPAVTGNISTLQSQMSSVSSFLTTCITNLTTNTPQNLSITNPSLNTWNIDYISPASGISGILYSDYSDSTTLNTSWTTVKSYIINSLTLTKNGDKLVAQVRFVCPAPSGIPYTRIQFNGITIVQNFGFSLTKYNVINYEVWIVRTSNTSVDLLLKWKVGADGGSFYAMYPTEIDSYIIPIAGLNLSTTPYTIDCDIQSVIAGDTTCKYLEVEYIKHL